MKCVVPACQHEEIESGTRFFAVPRATSKLFYKWTKFIPLSGNQNEKICAAHFTSKDFITYRRRIMKTNAVPAFHLPKTGTKVDPDGLCCIRGCPIKMRKYLLKFPSQSRRLKAWKRILDIDYTTKLMICHRHFSTKDFKIVESVYLKPSAVPSKKVSKIVKSKKRVQRMKRPPTYLCDHNYCAWYSMPPKSNKICFIPGCCSRASKDTSLHKFPKPTENQYRLWLNAIKCRKIPSKNSTICSNHFVATDYLPGRRRLKTTAVPSKHLFENDSSSKNTSTNLSTSSCTTTERYDDDNDHTSSVDHEANNEDIRSSKAKVETDKDSTSHATDFASSNVGTIYNVNQDVNDIAKQQCSIVGRKHDDSLLNGNRSGSFHLITGNNTEGDNEKQVPTIDNETQDDSRLGGNAFGLEMIRMSTQRTKENKVEEEEAYVECSPAKTTKQSLSINNRTQDDSQLEDNDSAWDASGMSSQLIERASKKLKHKEILSDLLITDKEVSVWTGIPTIVQLEEICLAYRSLESSLFPRKFKMHATDRVILTLAKLKQNISFEALGTLFRISGVTVSHYFSATIQVLARIMKRFVYWPTRDELKKNIPLCFREHFPNVTVILDATEIPICSLKCLNCRIACYSNYKSRRTVKFLVGVSPAGLITFISRGYSGKSSDKMIFNEEKIIDRMVPHVDEIMVDKGVSIEKECSIKCIKLLMPPFLRGERLSAVEASRNEAIARARIHVERVIQRIKLFGILNCTVNAATLGHIDDIMDTICGIVNLTNPVLRDDKF